MNTYYITQQFSGEKQFTIEAESEEEALELAYNGDWEPESTEETNWEYPEVVDVELGKKDFIVTLELNVEATSIEYARSFMEAQGDHLEGRGDGYDADSAEITEVRAVIVTEA